jgi:hypothetical protein
MLQDFETVSALVPPKVVLPLTVETVKVTEPVRFGIPDFEMVQVPDAPVVHEAEPVAPLLHAPDTVAPDSGVPSLATAIVTFAVQAEPLFAPDPVRETLTPVLGELTVTLCDVLPVAPPSSVTVNVTVYMPAETYV